MEHDTDVDQQCDGRDEECLSEERSRRFHPIYTRNAKRYSRRQSDGSEGDAYAISDMSAAYSGDKKMVRGMRMTADKKWLIVRDEMKLDEGDVGYWFAHTRGKINVSEDGKSATIEMGGEKLYCAILGEGEFTVMPAKHLFDGHVQETQRDNSDVTKLTVRFIGSTNLSVAIAPMEDGKAPEVLPMDKPFSQW